MISVSKFLVGAILATASLMGCADAQTTTIEFFPEDQWSNPDRYSSRKLRQNMLPEQAAQLLEGHTHVWHWEDGEGKEEGGAVTVVHYGRNGRAHRCWLQDLDAAPEYQAPSFEHVWAESEDLGVAWPLVKWNREDREQPGYTNFQYNAATGQLTGFIFQRPYWWEASVGHLQTEIPAVTYELCPQFPSAASLGVEVNEAQTARTYHTLLAQDPGTRVLRPDLVTQNSLRWLDEEPAQ